MSKKTKTTSKAKAKARAAKSDPNLVPLSKAMKNEKGKQKSRTSGLDAAAGVLKAAAKPMRCKEIVETMLAEGTWKTEGKTPAATIYSAILREIQTKGSKARFKKSDRGLFTLNPKA
jgi:hypothetical protein